MTDRAAQLRAGAARSREAKRRDGLKPHEHWYRDEEAAAVAQFFRDLAAARAAARAAGPYIPFVEQQTFS